MKHNNVQEVSRFYILFSGFLKLINESTVISFRFDDKESVSGVQQLKSSVQKAIRAKLLESYPHLENYIEAILPKKDSFKIVKWFAILI